MADPHPASRPVRVAAGTSVGLFVLASLVALAINFEAPSSHDTNVSGGDVLVPLVGVLLVSAIAAGATAAALLGALAGWATARWNLASGLAAAGLAGGALAGLLVHAVVPAPSDRPHAWFEFAALLALPPMLAALAASRVRPSAEA